MTQPPSADLPPPQAHGMDAGLAEPDWPPLTLAEVRDLAPQYAALDGSLRIVWHSPRPFSAAARVQAAQGEVFIKRHDTRVRDRAGLLEEHRFIAHLRQRGFGVPHVLANRSQVTATVLGNYTYEVHAPVPGIDAYRDVHSWVPVRDVDDARALGAALARLHQAAGGYAAAPRAPRVLLAGIDIIGCVDLAQGLSRYLEARPVVRAYIDDQGGSGPLLEALHPAHASLVPLLPALEPLWVHNDWHASNLFWSDADAPRAVVAAIDFGLCNRGWAVADLATALERNTVAWLEPGDDRGRPDLAQALIRAYCAVRPLTPAECAALPLLLSLAHVEYALSEVDYFHGVVGNDANAALAYPGFVFGHIAWFAGPQGRAYLSAVRAALAGVPALAPDEAR